MARKTEGQKRKLNNNPSKRTTAQGKNAKYKNKHKKRNAGKHKYRGQGR